jgi:hypothetical protein
MGSFTQRSEQNRITKKNDSSQARKTKTTVCDQFNFYNVPTKNI